MDTVELAARAGISYRQLDWWIARGYVPGAGPIGSGVVRSFTRDQVEFVERMAALVRDGMTPSRAAQHIHNTTMPTDVGPFLDPGDLDWWHSQSTDMRNGLLNMAANYALLVGGGIGECLSALVHLTRAYDSPERT